MSDDRISLLSSTSEEVIEFKLYRRRWLLLFIFICFSLINSFQWVQYTIIADVIQQYYHVGSMAVDWTSIIYMVTYIPLMFPAMHFLDKMGLRWSIILGTLGTAAGSCIKIASVRPDLFWVTFVGQTLVAMSQVFMLSVPPSLAAIWFGANEVSTACSIGVFGSMLGIALGFLLPPLIVKNHDQVADIGSELALMFYYTAGFSTAVFVSAVAFFQARPPTPPSHQQAMQKENASRNEVGIWNLVKRLLCNRGYMFVVAAFSINQGVFNAVSTLLNELILIYFKGAEEFAGRIGLVSVIGAMVGGISLGILLDKTHKFKEITLGVFALGLVGMIAFSFTLQFQSEVVAYITASVLGLFVGGYVPIAYDFATELTYPEPEGMTAGILTLPAQICGTIFTLGYGAMIRSLGDISANIVMCCALLVGTVLHIAIRPDLRRQAAIASINNSVEP